MKISLNRGAMIVLLPAAFTLGRHWPNAEQEAEAAPAVRRTDEHLPRTPAILSNPTLRSDLFIGPHKSAIYGWYDAVPYVMTWDDVRKRLLFRGEPIRHGRDAAMGFYVFGITQSDDHGEYAFDVANILSSQKAPWKDGNAIWYQMNWDDVEQRLHLNLPSPVKEACSLICSGGNRK